jgi:hypothetical protein
MAQSQTQPASPVPTNQPQRATRYQVRGVAPIGQYDFFGPGQPQWPMGPPGQAGRILDYTVGENIRITPRQDERLTYWDLIELAENHDVTRILIETRKDQMEAMEFHIKPKGSTGKEGINREQQYRIDKTTAFFEAPDGQHPFETWQREIIEQCLVIDATSIYVDKSDPKSTFFTVIDGATIKRVIDEQGRSPLPKDGPAYQQVIHGMPAFDYTSDELFYAPRNRRVNKLYGMSPVQQIYLTINIALRRESSVLQYFTDGSVPDALIQVPENWSMSQIQDAQQLFDSTLSGNYAERRKMRFIPGGSKYYPTKEIVLKSDFDEWLARVASFAFNVPPTWIAKSTNRASAQTLQEAAVVEGLMPLMRWFKMLMNALIQQEKHLGQWDLEFDWVERQDADPDARDKIMDRKMRRGQVTVNEGRAADGDDPIEGGDIPMVYAGQGPIPLAMVPKLAQAQLKQLNTPKAIGGGGAAGPMPKPNGRSDSSGKPQKRPTAANKAEVDEHSHHPFSIERGEKKSLYVRRDLLNAAEFIDWAKSCGFKTTLPADDIHVTVLFSKAKVDWNELTDSFDNLYIADDGKRTVEPLGDQGAVVLKFNSGDLSQRHDEFIDDFGASHDYDSYKPHVTITYDGSGVDLDKVDPFTGTLEFGPEKFEPIKEKWHDDIKEEVHKASEIAPTLLQRPYHEAEINIQNTFTTALAALGTEVKGTLEKAIGKFAKSETPEPDATPVNDQGIRLEEVPAYEAVLDAIETLSLDQLVATIEPTAAALASAGNDAATQALASVSVRIEATKADQKVLDFASSRAAELVGKKIVDGEIIDNPDAKWNITEPTREMLRQSITEGLQNGKGLQGLIKEIEGDYAFSHERAIMIARTETMNAHGRGALEGYLAAREEGIFLKKAWSAAPDACPICIENEDAGPIELDEPFPSGAMHPTEHPKCRCTLVPITEQYERELQNG